MIDHSRHKKCSFRRYVECRKCGKMYRIIEAKEIDDVGEIITSSLEYAHKLVKEYKERNKDENTSKD